MSHGHESGEFHGIALSRKMAEQPVNVVVDAVTLPIIPILFLVRVNSIVQSGKSDGGGHGGHGH